LNKGKRKKQPNIEIDKLYDFFQNLNTRDIKFQKFFDQIIIGYYSRVTDGGLSCGQMIMSTEHSGRVGTTFNDDELS
jgi:hypothetical protein